VSATITESKSGASETTDVPQEIHDLRKTWRFGRPHRPVLTPHRQQLMREPGRRWSLPSAGLVVGMFLALAFAATTRS
jgi:hypothetical protein